MNEPNDAARPELPYFSVSIAKLLVMTCCTFGLYEVYWFYKNWSLIKKRDSLTIRPFWRGVFSIFFCNACFADIHASAEKLGLQKNFNAGGLAAGWILTTIAWRLPDPYWLVTYCAVLFMIPVQGVANEINRSASPDHEINSSYSGWNIFGIVVGGIMFVLSLVGVFMPAAPALPQ
jgi:hypothetical protein